MKKQNKKSVLLTEFQVMVNGEWETVKGKVIESGQLEYIEPGSDRKFHAAAGHFKSKGN
jgi:ribosome-associated protein YbcJ (S4-like RNA binding protein)